MKTRLIHALVAAALIAGGNAASAAESALGSSSAQARVFSTNYSELVKAALPPVASDQLSAQLKTVAATAAAEKPLAVGDVSSLERFFGLAPSNAGRSGEIVDAQTTAYRYDPAEARIYLTYKRRDLKPVPRAEFAKQLPTIRAQHQELLQKLGVDSRQVFFTDFRETLSQTNGSPKTGLATTGEIESAGATTVILRAIDGMIVDGSRMIVSSADASNLELVDVKWPRVKLSERVFKYGTVSPAEHAEYLAKRIGSASKGAAVNVRMAVVLRPVVEAEQIAFVPTLRVGVQPQAIKRQDGYSTDAGEEFYVDLVRTGTIEGDADALEEKVSAATAARR